MLGHQVLHAVTEEKDNQGLTYNMPCANSRDEPSWETQLHSLTLPERWSVLSHSHPASFLLSLQKQAEECLFNTSVVCKPRLDLAWGPGSVLPADRAQLGCLRGEETQNFWWPSHTLLGSRGTGTNVFPITLRTLHLQLGLTEHNPNISLLTEKFALCLNVDSR